MEKTLTTILFPSFYSYFVVVLVVVLKDIEIVQSPIQNKTIVSSSADTLSCCPFRVERMFSTTPGSPLLFCRFSGRRLNYCHYCSIFFLHIYFLSFLRIISILFLSPFHFQAHAPSVAIPSTPHPSVIGY